MGNIVSSINSLTQLGQEASPGAGGAAGTKLRSMKIEPGEELTIRQIQAMGHRFDTDTVLDMHWSSFVVTEDAMLYTEHLYCLENIFGTVSPGTLGTATKTRTYNVAATGSITPKTWVQQWGDPNDNVNSYSYGLLTDYGETWDRESGVKQNGSKGIGQIISTGATFTSSPKQLASVPIGAGDFNIYLDTTWAGLGTTQITDEIDTLDWSISGMKTARWAANRSKPSFAGHIDVRPKATAKITIYEGPVARPIIASLISGNPYFLRVQSKSATYIDNYFTLGVGGASAGTFTLTYKGQTTAGIAYNAAAGAVQSALTALSTIGTGNVTVTGTAPNWTITMAGALANDPTVMTGSGAGLTGGSFSITQTANPYTAQRDFSLLLTKAAALKDTKGIYGRELEFDIVEDVTSGNVMSLVSWTAEATL